MKKTVGVGSLPVFNTQTNRNTFVNKKNTGV